MSQGLQVVVLGAGGAAGDAVVELLAARSFPLAQLVLLDVPEKAGEQRRFVGKTLYVQEANTFDWQQAQLAFFVAGMQASAEYVRAATEAGCVVVDGSGLFAGMDNVPLVVPGVNDAVLALYSQRNIVALADGLVCQLLLALQPLLAGSALAAVQVTTLLAASVNGHAAVQALAGQSALLLNGQPLEDCAPFIGQLAFNALPLLPDEQGQVAAERRLVDGVRKVLQQPDLPVSAACVQVPVFYGHGQLVSVTLQQALSVQQAQLCWQGCEYVRLAQAPEFAAPVHPLNVAEQLAVACVRENYGVPGELQFWSVADNVRFSSALMAVQVAERLLEHWRS